MADDVYFNQKVPNYQIGKFQFQSGILRLTSDIDKLLFQRILVQIPQPDRANITLLSSDTYYQFPPGWVLQLDLLLAEIAAAGPDAQAEARANLGVVDTPVSPGAGITDGDKGDIIVSSGGTVWRIDPTWSPDITAPTILNANAVSVLESAQLAFPLTASEQVTWSLDGGPDVAQFSLSANILRWVANGVQDFESPLDIGANNVYDVTVRATDVVGNSSILPIAVTVLNVDDSAPVITSPSTGSVLESTVLAFNLTANKSVTWSFAGGVDQAQFEISGSTLRWASNGTRNFESPTDVGGNNIYDVTVRATDVSLNTQTQAIAITVTDVDEVAPTITSPASASVAENSVLALPLTANEAVTWSIVGGVDSAQFELASNLLRWSANGARNFEAPADTGADNVYNVQIRATDLAGNATNQNTTITVTNVDEVAPTITSSATISVNENATLSHSLTADETVTWSLNGGVDTSQFEISGSTLRWLGNGTKNFESPTDTGSNNVYNVTIRATDLAGNQQNQSMAVTVLDVAEGGALPATQTISFGAKTRKGHGGHSLGYTGSGTLSITAGDPTGLWTIDSRNQLVPAGAYGGSVSGALVGPYTLTVTDGTLAGTVTINILANAAHWRSVNVAPNADSGATSQLRTLLSTAGAVARGDTLWLRNGSAFNPTCVDSRIRPPSGLYSGAGSIVIRPESPFAATMGRIWFDSAAMSAAGSVFIEFRDMQFLGYNTSSATVTTPLISRTGTFAIRDVHCYNCRFERDPAATQPMSGVTPFSNGVIDHCYFGDLYDGITGSSANAFVTFCEMQRIQNDCIKGTHTDITVEDNFFHDKYYYTTSSHGDFMQDLGVTGTPPQTRSVGSFRRNIFARGSVVDPTQPDGQGLFLDDTISGNNITNVTAENNIYIGTFVNGISMTRATNPTVRRNTVLNDVTATLTTPANANINSNSGSGGTYENNVANGYVLQAGSTSLNNNTIGRTLTAYNSAFQNASLAMAAASKADVIAGLKPVLGGPLLNGDGTYSGALFPNGTWNDGSIYVGP